MMVEIAKKGDAGVNKLIEAVGIEVLVAMAKQENTLNGRSNIEFVMAEIASNGDALVKALVAMAKQENTPQKINDFMNLMLMKGFRNEVISSLLEMANKENTPEIE